jgi:hypothetical protein
MFLSQEHQQHGQAYKKDTGEDFFSADVPFGFFHLFIICHGGHGEHRVRKSPLPPFDKGGLGGIFQVGFHSLCPLCALWQEMSF